MDNQKSHDGYNKYLNSLETSDIEAEIIDSVDDYYLTDQKVSFSKPPSEDEESVKGENLMPICRNRSSSNNDAFHDIDAARFDQQTSGAQKAVQITSSHTPTGNYLLNLGGRIRTNFRSFVNRRENVYTAETGMSFPLKNRRSSSNYTANNFSTIPGDLDQTQSVPTKTFVDAYEVYDGTQQCVDLHLSDKSSISRSPSVGPPTTKRQLRLRSSSEVRYRMNLCDEEK